MRLCRRRVPAGQLLRAFVVLTIAAVAVIKVTEAQAAASGVLTNRAFQNFDLKCSPSESVSGLVYKKFVSSNGTADLELSIFCRSIGGSGDPAPTVSASNCRYGTKFALQNNASEPGSNTDCKSDEYINGMSGTFEKSIRMLRLRCCKASNLHVDQALGCHTVGPESITAVAVTGIRDPDQPKSGCPKNALSSFSVSRGKLIVRFCPMALDGAKYESYCYSGQKQRDTAKREIGRFLLEQSVSDQHDISSTKQFEQLQNVKLGEETQYGQSFEIQCPKPSDAFNRFEVRYGRGGEDGGEDLLFRFSCKPVVVGEQKAFKKRVSKFVRPKDIDSIVCFDNETLCGLFGFYNRSWHTPRRYAFACCQGSNWYSNSIDDDQREEINVVVRSEDDGGGGGGEKQRVVSTGAGADEKRIQSFSIAIDNHTAVITTIFQTYRYNPVTGFTQNTTSYEYKETADKT